MVLSPRVDGGMSGFIGWITLTHTQRYHAHHRTTGYGHVVCRYVERNALRANLVKRAEQYRWGSLWNWVGGDSPIDLSPWPVRRLPNWVGRVNQALSKGEHEALARSIKRGVPFGSEDWVEETVKRCRLESTMRPRGRPKKLA